MRAFYVFLLCSLMVSWTTAQESLAEEGTELLIEGRYTGYSLYVMNPSVGDDFCVNRVSVNGKPIAFAEQSHAFEISLADCQVNDFVVVQITHSQACTPTVINSDKLLRISTFNLPSFAYSKKSKLLSWKMEELQADCRYDVEQLLYGKWIVIKSLGSPDEMIADNYLPVMLSGMNHFRIRQTQASGEYLYSPSVSVKSPNRRIMIMSDRVKEVIEFTEVTHYELYDENGFFIQRGTAKKVNVATLKKGVYWLNFDGKEIQITKK